MIEHPYFTPGGPTTYEFPLPITTDDCRGFPDGFNRWVGLSPSSIQTKIADDWSELPTCCSPLVDYVLQQSPRSLAKLTSWNSYWLVFEGPTGYSFVPQPNASSQELDHLCNGDICDWDTDFDRFMKCFAGFKHSTEFPPSAGFLMSPLNIVTEADPSLNWGATGEWESAISFYSTGSGSVFVFGKSGKIAKWSWNPGEQTMFTEAFSDLEAFLSALVEYIQRPTSQSPLHS